MELIYIETFFCKSSKQSFVLGRNLHSHVSAILIHLNTSSHEVLPLLSADCFPSASKSLPLPRSDAVTEIGVSGGSAVPPVCLSQHRAHL